MTVLLTILGILYLVVCVVVCIIILMQEPKQQGISVVTGESESFFGRNRGSTKEARLTRYTITGAVFFAVIAVVLGALLRLFSQM
ncbi:MAG: preprotein translocase subunit SecG [Clostridiaceae bacterium]|nr:preprotein translocase subunit SecG [Clostridiaceae bacterium]